MVTKFIMLEFADCKHRAIDSISDIREAAKHAGMNLCVRHGIRLGYPMPYNDKVIVEVEIPDDLIPSFRIGYHLRGLSTNLKRIDHSKYKGYQVGNRLLTYYEVPDPSTIDKNDSNDKMTLLAQMISLLRRDDDEAHLMISKIAGILNSTSIDI